MRSVITLAKSLTALAALVLLASCAETPSTPTTSGGTGSGSGKVVTATPEEPFDCDDDLILEPHLPEECIPPEPVKPAEPPKPDPIVGTYRVFTTESDGYWNSKHGQYVFRIYPNNRASKNGRNDFYRWEREGEVYKFFVRRGGPGSATAYDRYSGAMKYQSIAGEPHLITIDHLGQQLWPSEGLKISTDPSHQFDFYKVVCRYRRDKTCFRIKRDAEGKNMYKAGRVDGIQKHVWIQEPLPGWSCMNIGRYRGSYLTNYPIFGDATDWGDTLAECESRCEQALLNQFETVGEGNCSDFRG